MPIIYRLFYLLILTLLWAPSSYAFTNLQTQQVYQLTNNHNPEQCGQSLSGKKEFSFGQIKANQNYCLLLEFNSDKTSDVPQLLFISALASAEIILDGKRLAMNGRVGESAATEIPGNIEFWVSLSAEQLNTGPHQLILKLSTYHAPSHLSQYFYSIFIQDQQEFFHHKQLMNLLPVMLSGGLALVAIILLVLSISIQRQAHWWIFCLLCASASILLMTEVWRSLFGYAYPSHILRLYLILFTAGIFSLLLPWYFLSLYQMRNILFWIMGIFSLILLLAFAPISFDGKVYLTLFSVLIISLVINLLAVKKSTQGGVTGLVIIGLSLGLILWQRFYFAEQGFAWVVCLLLMSLLYQLVQQFRYEKTKAAMAIQLENQLLHRSLQPHFLMNSLALINELIHQAPDKAEQFIQALATEFRLLNYYVNRPTISLLQEVELCQNYLQMINIRHHLTHTFNIEGDASGIEIPPAVLLTPLENAFSHHKYQQAVLFSLKIDKQYKRVKLTLELPGAQARPHQGNGIGNLYIQQSLQQIFANKASCKLQEVNNIWFVTIELPL